MIDQTKPRNYRIVKDLFGWAVCRDDRTVWVAQTRSAARQAVEEYKREDERIAEWHANKARERAALKAARQAQAV